MKTKELGRLAKVGPVVEDLAHQAVLHLDNEVTGFSVDHSYFSTLMPHEVATSCSSFAPLLSSQPRSM